MMKKRTCKLFVIIIFILSSVNIFLQSFAYAQEDSKQNTKNTAISKKKPIKIQPGDVYPGDAAVAGYNEELSFNGKKEIRKYVFQNKELHQTYIFSEVEGALEENNGYFRVLKSYGYDKPEMNWRDHLVLATSTGYPVGEKPMQLVRDKKSRYIVLFTRYQFIMYDIYEFYGHGPFRLWYLDQCVPEQEITDIDGDGFLEIKAYTTLEGRGECWYGSPGDRGYIPVIYRIAPRIKGALADRFQGVKGKRLEKVLVQMAEEQKNNAVEFEKKRVIKSEKEKPRIEEGHVLHIHLGMIGWLAGIESTENPELIRKVLYEFQAMQYYDDETKKSIISLLVKHGYKGLGVDVNHKTLRGGQHESKPDSQS